MFCEMARFLRGGAPTGWLPLGYSEGFGAALCIRKPSYDCRYLKAHPKLSKQRTKQLYMKRAAV